MERFCIITNCGKDKNFTTTEYIKNYLEKRKKQCVLTYDENRMLTDNNCTDTSLIPPDTECAIVLGGDGTIIRAANDLLSFGIPMLGINLGTLGFLTEIEQSNIDMALDRLIEGQCEIEMRMMLGGQVHRGDDIIYEGFAMNDVVINRSGFSRMISIDLYVNDKYVDTYYGDGIIVSTPTGSTGYSLSAGGPIVTPNAKAIIITPICCHSLSNRSIIVSADDKVVVHIGEGKKNQKGKAIAVFDGNPGLDLDIGDSIVISKAKEEAKLVRINDTSFFEILRNKF